MAIYTFGMLNQINRTLFLGMDVKAAGDIDSFIGLDCQDPHISRCSISIPDLGGVIAVVTASNSVDYLKMMSSFQPDFNLKIYEGQINDDHLLTNINKSNYYYQFPIAVKDTVKIYKLARNQLTIPLFRNPDDVSYSVVYVGRLVDIHSFYVGQLVYQQDTFENFTTGNPNVLMNFSFKVKYFGYNGPSTTLEITVFRNGNTVFYEKYFEGNLPPTTTIGALGHSATVKYSTFKIYTYGFRVELLCAGNTNSGPIWQRKMWRKTRIMTPDQSGIKLH
uniref:CUB_2 domain-containing protein n=1 Tax=Caenorhabditis tropicalis TaxID=1561998 RepID=A0A1I7U9N2_9PELO